MCMGICTDVDVWVDVRIGECVCVFVNVGMLVVVGVNK